MDQLSVVIPTYNRPGFLQGAVESAVEQTYGNLEIIVVDDGSIEDYAMDVTEQFPPHVRCVIHETNRGLSAARNTGIENSVDHINTSPASREKLASALSMRA